MPWIAAIELEDWMRYAGAHRVELVPGVVLVRGPNWSGKSSLLDAVRWCLFGATRFRVEDEAIRRGALATRVLVQLSDGTRVERTRPIGGPTRCRVELADGTCAERRDAQGLIDAHLGCDKRSYESGCHLVQGSALALVEAGPERRRDILVGWVGKRAKAWDRALAAARSGLGQATAALREARAAAAALTSLDDVDVAGCEAAVQERRLELGAIERELAGVEARERLHQARSRVIELRDEALELETRDAARAEAETELGAASADVRRLEPLASGRFDGVCPAHGGTCPVPDQVVEQRDRIHDALGLARARRAQAATAANQARGLAAAAERAAREWRDWIQQFNEASAAGPGQTGDPKALAAGLELARTALAQAEARLGAVREVERRRAQLQDIADIAGLEREVTVASLAYRALRVVAGPAAIAGSGIESVASRMVGGCDLGLRLEWSRVTREYDEDCAGCGHLAKPGSKATKCAGCGIERSLRRAPDLAILVQDGNGEEDVAVKSGGARVLVAMALRLASTLVDPEVRVGWRVIDEGLGELDRENASRFSAMLGTARELGIDQILLVSHDPATSSVADAVVEVVPGPDGARVLRA